MYSTYLLTSLSKFDCVCGFKLSKCDSFLLFFGGESHFFVCLVVVKMVFLLPPSPCRSILADRRPQGSATLSRFSRRRPS